MRNVYFSSSQAPNRVKKILPPIDHSIPFSHKMLQEISIIVYYLRTTQFSICHLFLSLSPSPLSIPRLKSILRNYFIRHFHSSLQREEIQASSIPSSDLVWSRANGNRLGRTTRCQTGSTLVESNIFHLLRFFQSKSNE